MLRISELLPLSAAASGMMVGERQLGSLKEFIDASIRNAFQSSTSSIGMSECGLQRPRDYQFFSLGGKMRHVPADLKLVRPGSTLAEIWDLWWLGDLSPEFSVRPFRQILKNNRADVLEAYELRGERKATASKTICEIEQVIKFFLDEFKEIENPELSRTLQVLNSGNPLDDLEEMRTSAAKAWNIL